MTSPTLQLNDDIIVQLSIPIDDERSRIASIVLALMEMIDKTDGYATSKVAVLDLEHVLFLVSAKSALFDIRDKALAAAKKVFVDTLNSEECLEILRQHRKE